MNQNILLRLGGWAALIHGSAHVSSFIALMLFFAIGGIWGAINDSLSIIWALSLIPLAHLFFRINQPINPSLNALTAILGIGSMLIFASLQFLLVVGKVRFEQTLGAILTLTCGIGLWLLIQGLLIRASRTLPVGLVWVMLIYGLSLLLSGTSFWFGGGEHPLTAVGFLTGAIMGAVWAAWLARIVLTDRLLQTA